MRHIRLAERKMSMIGTVGLRRKHAGQNQTVCLSSEEGEAVASRPKSDWYIQNRVDSVASVFHLPESYIRIFAV